MLGLSRASSVKTSLGLAALVGLVGCSDSEIACEPWRGGEESAEVANPHDTGDIGVASQALVGNATLDTTGQFSAVVGVATSSGVATGVALSDRVVATAAHLVPDIVRGCRSLGYRAPDPVLGPSISDIMVHVADEHGNVFPEGGTPGVYKYAVDAVIGRPRVAPVNAIACCDSDPKGCDACAVTTAKPNWFHAFDIVLLHLDRPLYGVKPLRFVAHIGPTSSRTSTFPIAPLSWPGSVVVTLVGVGAVDLVGAPLGQRRFGPANVVDFNALWAASKPANDPVINFGRVAAEGACDTGSRETESCADCMMGVTGGPVFHLPGGGPGRIGGDSGAPVIVNDTAHGGTPIPGLPPGEPFVVALGSIGAWATNADGTWNRPIWDKSVVTWDTTLDSGERIDTGTWLQSHLTDWDQDGIDDAHDNCPITRNPSQANCNRATEAACGVAPRGDACDPSPCSAGKPRYAEPAMRPRSWPEPLRVEPAEAQIDDEAALP